MYNFKSCINNLGKSFLFCKMIAENKVALSLFFLRKLISLVFYSLKKVLYCYKPCRLRIKSDEGSEMRQ